MWRSIVTTIIEGLQKSYYGLVFLIGHPYEEVEMPMRGYKIYLNDDDYGRFRRCSDTKLYDHSRDKEGVLTIWTAKPIDLAENLASALRIDSQTALDLLDAQNEQWRKDFYR